MRQKLFILLNKDLCPEGPAAQEQRSPQEELHDSEDEQAGLISLKISPSRIFRREFFHAAASRRLQYETDTWFRTQHRWVVSPVRFCGGKPRFLMLF